MVSKLSETINIYYVRHREPEKGLHVGVVHTVTHTDATTSDTSSYFYRRRHSKFLFSHDDFPYLFLPVEWMEVEVRRATSQHTNHAI